ncbi:radical SAM protein [bacterium]|nr:radical SAM protein [bacterium]
MIGAVLRRAGYETLLLDCLDRFHPALNRDSRLRSVRACRDGTGHFIKEVIEKPTLLKSIPRRYGRYGIPLNLVRKLLAGFPEPDAIFVTSGVSFWYPGVVEMIALLKERFPAAPVALGGIYATLFPEHARHISGADVVVEGEGEKEALRLADHWTGKDSAAVESDFPEPDYSLYPVLKSAALLTSTGCPYRCPFCGSHLLSGSRRRVRDPEKAAGQVLRLYTERNVREFAFYDDALLLNHHLHLDVILHHITSYQIPVRFHTPNGMHPRWIGRDLAVLMREAGFATLRLSYETRNPDRQKSMGLKVTDADLTAAVGHLTAAGFARSSLGGYVLMGLPDQEKEEILDSMLFVFSLGIKVSMASFSPIPGTQSWDNAVARGLLRPDADPLLTNNSIYPLRSRRLDFRDFVKIGTLASEGNGIVMKGGFPLKDRDFMAGVRAYEQERAS